MELQQGENTVLPALKNQLKDTRKSIENIVDAIQNGMFHPSMKQRMDELEAAREQLEISIAQEEMQKPMLTKEQVIFWISRFKNGNVNDMAFRQRLIDTFVNAIYLYDDRIVLTYNYKDGSHTVTLAQVEETFGSEAKSGSDLGADAPPNGHWTNIYFSKVVLLYWCFINLCQHQKGQYNLYGEDAEKELLKGIIDWHVFETATKPALKKIRLFKVA